MFYFNMTVNTDQYMFDDNDIDHNMEHCRRSSLYNVLQPRQNGTNDIMSIIYAQDLVRHHTAKALGQEGDAAMYIKYNQGNFRIL